MSPCTYKKIFPPRNEINNCITKFKMKSTMTKIPKFQKAKLRFGAHFAVMSAFDEKVVVVVNGEPLLTSAYNTFKSALTDLDAAVKIARASEYSAQILKMDTIRDRLYSNVRGTSEMWEDLGIEPQATSARAVMHEVRIYKVDTRAQFDQETGLMMNFMQPFESAAMQEHLATLGLTAAFTQMKFANDEVRRLLALRGDERAANAAYDLKAARQATDAAYDALVERIEALNVIDDQHRFDTFIAQWSAEVARIRQQILSQSSGNSGSGANDGQQSTDNGQQSGGGDNGGSQSVGDSGGQQGGGTTPDPGTGGGGETPVNPDPDPGTGGGGGADPNDPNNSED